MAVFEAPQDHEEKPKEKKSSKPDISDLKSKFLKKK
jgi:hypothetical protein